MKVREKRIKERKRMKPKVIGKESKKGGKPKEGKVQEFGKNPTEWRHFFKH